MLRIFEAIKKSPFFNANFHFRPSSANDSAEIGADAQQKTYIKTLNPKLNFEFLCTAS